MVGSVVAGSGGRVILGTEGMVGIGSNVGFGKFGTVDIVGKGVVGIGGNVGFGKVGTDGIVGKGVVGSGGNVAWGTVGIAGSGGSLGIDGIAAGPACISCRAAKVKWILDRDNARIRGTTRI
ncbi:hypothetical protein RHMOL_Rhmol08G0017200 [Rhododendron molle]|uniref:Uncharacterized protein n=1 Tax=Rhododendron molle TaxID=49168 RepID=A0ACC0MK26_RHOML|nr:hypothetical protein RHMOL_Rhmol08G0017200 [Rhododendron molle]